jgi:TonB family protein
MRSALPFLIVGLMIGACAEPPPEVPPRQLPGSPFHYPEQLWDAGIEGETVLEIHVSESGRVDSARVDRSSGHAEFDSAAVNGARELRFEPARRGEENVAVRVLLPVHFHLPSDTSTAADDDDAAVMNAPVEP